MTTKEEITDFVSFIDMDLLPGVSEIENLADSNRIHVQRLVYSNLVDRFDYLVDKLLLESCTNEYLTDYAYGKHDDPLSESKFVRLFRDGQDIQSAVKTMIQNRLRDTLLRERHSVKLQKLMLSFTIEDRLIMKPRINQSTGNIMKTSKPSASIPLSISGYADWLYSRRNAIVHGGRTSKMLSRDLDQMLKRYRVKVADSFKLKLGSIRTAATFYKEVSVLLQQ